MSPTRRDILTSSAGAVAAALIGITTQPRVLALPETATPACVAMPMAALVLRFDSDMIAQFFLSREPMPDGRPFLFSRITTRYSPDQHAPGVDGHEGRLDEAATAAFLDDLEAVALRHIEAYERAHGLSLQARGG